MADLEALKITSFRHRHKMNTKPYICKQCGLTWRDFAYRVLEFDFHFYSQVPTSPRPQGSQSALGRVRFR